MPCLCGSFRINAVEELIDSYSPKFVDPNLAVLFANCLPNTVSGGGVLARRAV